MAEYDKWSRWLLETRFGGDEKIAELGLRLLRQVRYTLLGRAGLKDGRFYLTWVPATDLLPLAPWKNSALPIG